MTRLVSERYAHLLDDAKAAMASIDWDDYDTTDPHSMRKTRPIKAGDVVNFQVGSKPVTEGLVLVAGAYYLRRMAEWCSFYNVATKTKSGAWSKNWVRIYDGSIERGYGH